MAYALQVREQGHSQGPESSRLWGGGGIWSQAQSSGREVAPGPSRATHSTALAAGQGLGCRHGPRPGHHWKESTSFTLGSQSWLLVFVCSGALGDQG